MTAYIYLIIAIVSEVTATLLLPTTHEFTKVTPTLLAIMSYILSFYFMTLAMRSISVGTVYAIWSGIGIVLIICGDYFLYQQKQDVPALIGMSFIILGVFIMNFFSNTVTHP